MQSQKLGQSSNLKGGLIQFRRYQQYQKSNSSGSQCQLQNQQIQTDIIMMPLPYSDEQRRSKTAFSSRKTMLSFKNIGEIVEVKPKLGLRHAYSRENIQIINKRIKQLKQHIFGSNTFMKKQETNKNSKTMELMGKVKIVSSQRPFVPRRKNYTSQNMRFGLIEQNQNFIKQKNHKDNQKDNYIKSQVTPYNFVSTLKPKHVDDNPKVLANIIKKKVEGMRTMQVHEYINRLIKRKTNY